MIRLDLEYGALWRGGLINRPGGITGAWYEGESEAMTKKSHFKKSETRVYKEQLLFLRARLRGDVNTMADAALKKKRSEAGGDLSSMPIHMADVGSDNFEQEFTLSLMESGEETLEQIEDALERIEDGVYGVCVECTGKIPKTRLNAIPHTPHCVKCARQLQSG